MKDIMIHIVDDDEAVRSSIRMLIHSYGWQSRAFASVREFLEELFKGGAPDCLVLDLNMPGMNGAELLEMPDFKESKVPVIVITGLSNSQLAQRARRAGAKQLLDKPLRDDELKSSIERVLTAA